VRGTGEPEAEKGLVSASYVDPRDLGPNSPVRDLARAYLQELRDKGRSETTLPRYERFLVEFLEFIERDGAKIRLDEYLDRWLKTVKSQLCSKTYEGYESLLAKYIRPSLGKKNLVGIRPLDVQGVYQAMSDRGLSPRTVQGAHWVLNAAFRQALRGK